MRHPRTLTTALALAATLTLAACGGGDEPAPAESVPTTETMTDTMTETMTDTMTETMTDTMTDTMVDQSALAAWQTIEITDVDGHVFSFADLIGTPVVVETFATWCPKCRAQLGVTNAAATELGADAHVIALSVETDLSSDDVADYADDNGFDAIRFAVMSPELLAAIVDAFGQSAANPPSTPKFVIDAMGHPGELTTGSESAEVLIAAVRG
jgi:thiol-disulfide isomerase/thioredoxin